MAQCQPPETEFYPYPVFIGHGEANNTYLSNVIDVDGTSSSKH